MSKVKYGRFFTISDKDGFLYEPGKITFGTSDDGKYLDDDHNEDIENELMNILVKEFPTVEIGVSESIHWIPNKKGNKDKLREVLTSNGWTECKIS